MCYAIAEALPNYFSESGLKLLKEDLSAHDVLVAETGGRVNGFITLARKSRAVREIGWLAVHPRGQGGGAGSELVEAAEAECRRENVQILEVKTLAPKKGAPNYDATRRFYERHGFLCVEIIDPFPGWDPGNPCAIYVKPLR